MPAIRLLKSSGCILFRFSSYRSHFAPFVSRTLRVTFIAIPRTASVKKWRGGGGSRKRVRFIGSISIRAQLSITTSGSDYVINSEEDDRAPPINIMDVRVSVGLRFSLRA